MTILQLLNAANTKYPDNFLSNYYDEETGKFDKKTGGDTLAEFIVREIIETYDPDLSDWEQIEDAVRCMETAQRDLECAIKGLESIRVLGRVHGNS